MVKKTGRRKLNRYLIKLKRKFAKIIDISDNKKYLQLTIFRKAQLDVL